ncbi:MAG: hypothetical protein DMG20_02590 [Acidobacteria bacterium]|nr:MAG: hypothetical protein DMG20_02590 [Acidobacteriota bacterium]
MQGAGFVSYQAVILPKLSDRDVQNPNAGDSLRKIYGNAEATQIQDILNRAIRNRQQRDRSHFSLVVILICARRIGCGRHLDRPCTGCASVANQIVDGPARGNAHG